LEILTEVDAKKETLSGDYIWQLVEAADKVVVTSGKKILEFTPTEDKEEMLKKMSGRTGNLRAPTLKCGNVFYVGYNDELYNDVIA
jgi:predicted house-cleaning NTP pyrophosphatase (Maf/HAM1 superfamily)